MSSLGYSLVLSACLMSALGAVLTKVISKGVEKVIILFYLGVATCCCGTIGLFTFGHPSIPGYEEWLLAIAIGLLGLLQQYALVWALEVRIFLLFQFMCGIQTEKFFILHSK